MSRLLVNSDVLIDHSRDRDAAVAFFAALADEPMVSAVTVTEVLGGIRAKAEEALFKDLFDRIDIVPVTREIAELAGAFRRQYGPSHGTGAIDAIIAATAELTGVRLATQNRKHFPMLNDIVSPGA